MDAVVSAYIVFVGVLVAAVIAPALIVGGGFAIALGVALVVVVALIGGPKLWKLHLTRSVGANAGANMRNVIQGDGVGHSKNRE